MSDLPPPMTYYVNIYPQFAGSCGTVYATRAIADQMAAASRIACKMIQVAAGDGIAEEGERDSA